MNNIHQSQKKADIILETESNYLSTLVKIERLRSEISQVEKSKLDAANKEIEDLGNLISESRAKRKATQEIGNEATLGPHHTLCNLIDLIKKTNDELLKLKSEIEFTSESFNPNSKREFFL